MEFLFSCSTRHLTRSLRSLVSYRVTHRNSISTRAHVLFSIYLMKNHYYTKKGLLGQDLPTIWFAKTLALDEMPRDRANVCGKSSGKSPIVSVKIPESEKHLTPFPRLKATKLQILSNSTDAHCNTGKLLSNFGLIFLPFQLKKRPNFWQMFSLKEKQVNAQSVKLKIESQNRESASTHSTIVIRGLSIHLFSFIDKVGLSSH